MKSENYEVLRREFNLATTGLEEDRCKLIELQDQQREITQRIRICRESIKNRKEKVAELSKKILDELPD